MPAPRTLWVYILRDVALQALIGLLALTLLVLAQSVLRFIDRFAEAGVPLAAFPLLAWILLTRYSVYALPSALVFGVLLSFGRMSADGEIIAMRASGVSVRRILPPVLAIGLLASSAIAWVLFEVEPRGNLQLRELERELLQSVRVVRAGEFRSVGPRTIYVHEVGDETCPLQGVMVSDSSDERGTLYIAARCGLLRSSEAEEDALVLELVDGSVHFSDTETDNYRHIRFQSLETSLDLSAYLHPRIRARDLRFSELLDADRRLRAGETLDLAGGAPPEIEVRVQLHRRLAFPLASLALALLAVPLGVRPLRAGRSWGALTAILVMAGYWCLFTVCEIAAISELAPVALAMWTPDLVIVGLAFALIRRSMHTDS
jgi:lipopolysaccharide export system permease protein